jgi:hypothetical protein
MRENRAIFRKYKCRCSELVTKGEKLDKFFKRSGFELSSQQTFNSGHLPMRRAIGC